MMTDIEILGSMLALLGPGTLLMVLGLRVLRALDLYHPPSLIAPAAIVTTLLPAAWIASAVTRDHNIARQAGVDRLIYHYALLMPFIMVALAVCIAGPFLLATSIPTVARALRARPPSVRRSVAGSLCTVLLLGVWVTVGAPFQERIAMFDSVRSRQASRDDLMRYAAIAVSKFDAQLGNIVARSPDSDARVFAVLAGRCMTRPDEKACRDWLARIAHHGRSMPPDMRVRIRNAIGLRAING